MKKASNTVFVRIDPEVHRALKIRAAKEGISMKALAERILRAKIEASK